MRIRPLSGLVLAAALSAGPAAADDPNSWSSILADFFVGPAVRESFDWSGELASGRTLEIKGVNGAIKAVPGARLEVHAVKKGRRHAPSEVKIEVVPHAGGITICSLYPSPDETPNVCRPGSEGRIRVRNNDVTVDYTVTVPPGVKLAARTVNGPVEAMGLTADTVVTTVNGPVHVETSGRAEAETVNGPIVASIGRTGDGPLAFKTVNGPVTVRVPASADAQIRAETVNGRIDTDLTLQSASVGRRKLTGTLGKGGPELSVVTVNGPVSVLRR
jgi:hypothetical protein